MAEKNEDEICVEYDALRSCQDTIYRGCLNSPSLCKHFHENGLISYDVLSTYSGKFEENEKLSRNIVDTLVSRVKDDRNAFATILYVLRLEKSLVYLADKLESKKMELEKTIGDDQTKTMSMGRAAAPPQVSDSSKSAELTTSAAKSASRVPQKSPKFPPEPLPKAEKSASDEAEQCTSE